MVKIFKFGGASVKDANGVRNVAKILSKYSTERIAIVISAMGKTTNALEDVIASHVRKDGNAHNLYEKLKQAHYTIMDELFEKNDEIYELVNDTFIEAEWVLDEEPHEDYDYMYDQIIGVGELVSTRIVNAYLNKANLPSTWLDARDIIRTDNTYREGRVQWKETEANTRRLISPLLEQGGFIMTQGFIASSSENFMVSLGREGSDYTAAILAYCLDAVEMTIWKDVAGVLNADPRLFENVTKLDRLSYKEAIEMTYYGATVIHPKTIKPLQNKNIPLNVKSFLNPDVEGTQIGENADSHYPPIIIIEKNQALLYISSKDFSFIAEHHLSRLFALFDKHRIWINMMRNTAISFMVCVPNQADRLKRLFDEMEEDFTVVKQEEVELITVRHYHEEVIDNLKKGNIVLLEERIRKTFQMVVKKIPMLKRKEG